MADLALRWNPDELVADLAIEANDLVQETSLRTAVLLSLYLDRQAEAADQLPPGETDRRGWWADAAPVVPGDRVGSRLWLLAREKGTPAVRARAERYAREALQWLIDDRVASRLEVAADFPRPGWLALEIQLFKPNGDPVSFRFDSYWDTARPYPELPAAPPEDIGVVSSSDEFFATSEGYYLTTA